MSIGHVKEFSKLTAPENESVYYWADVEFVIVSIWLNDPPRLFVTDFTENENLKSEYVRENFIEQDYDNRIPKNKILQLTVFGNKLMPFISAIERIKGEKLRLGSGCTNVLSFGIFARANVRFRMYSGSLEGLVTSIVPLDQSWNNVDLSFPIYRNVITSLPTQFVRNHIELYQKTIPASELQNLISSKGVEQNISSSPFVTPNHPRSFNNQAPALGSTQNNVDQSTSPEPPQFKLSSRDDLLSDGMHDSDFETPQRSRRRERSSQRATPHVQVPATCRGLVKGAISKLNKIDICDGTSYDVNGLIVDFRPLQNQFCIKSIKKEYAVLNPIKILVTGGKDDYPNEDQFLRISFINNTEILAFLGYEELEEVYLDKDEISQKVETILKSKVIFQFKVRRRHIKINDSGNYILGWDGVELTLDGLLNQIERS